MKTKIIFRTHIGDRETIFLVDEKFIRKVTIPNKNILDFPKLVAFIQDKYNIIRNDKNFYPNKYDLGNWITKEELKINYPKLEEIDTIYINMNEEYDYLVRQLKIKNLLLNT